MNPCELWFSLHVHLTVEEMWQQGFHCEVMETLEQETGLDRALLTWVVCESETTAGCSWFQATLESLRRDLY